VELVDTCLEGAVALAWEFESPRPAPETAGRIRRPRQHEQQGKAGCEMAQPAN